MQSSLTITQAQLVLPDRVVTGDLIIEEGIITEISPHTSRTAGEVINGTGLTVLPGLIDSHVHFREPGWPEVEDIASGSSQDCDQNGIPDECDWWCHTCDCNDNGMKDESDISSGASQDCNSNGVPDECEFSALQAQPYCHCDTSAPCGNEDPGAGCANQSGDGAVMSVCGSSTITDDDLVIRVENVSPQQFGLVFMGPGQQQVPFGNGQLCVGPGGLGVFRYPARNAGFAGVISEGPGLVAYSQASFGVFGTITPGQTWNFQGWYRDPFGPCGTSFNLSNAVAVTFGS